MCMDKKQNRDFLEGKNFVISGIVFALIFAAVAAGQDANSSDANEGIGSIAAAGSADSSIQSITFKKDVSIRDALRFLAVKYQKNIVPSPKVSGNITVGGLYNVSFKEALDSILGYNFKYDEEGNFIRVYTAEEYKAIKEDKSRMTHKVFTLYYVSAADASKMLNPVKSQGGTINASSPAEKGISLGAGSVSGSGGSSVGGTVGGDTLTQYDTIVMFDFPENIAKAENVIKLIDVRPQQVLIEATILSATLTEGMELGVDWNLLNGVNLIGSSATGDLVSGDTVSRGHHCNISDTTNCQWYGRNSN